MSGEPHSAPFAAETDAEEGVVEVTREPAECKAEGALFLDSHHSLNQPKTSQKAGRCLVSVEECIRPVVTSFFLVDDLNC